MLFPNTLRHLFAVGNEGPEAARRRVEKARHRWHQRDAGDHWVSLEGLEQRLLLNTAGVQASIDAASELRDGVTCYFVGENQSVDVEFTLTFVEAYDFGGALFSFVGNFGAPDEVHLDNWQNNESAFPTGDQNLDTPTDTQVSGSGSTQDLVQLGTANLTTNEPGEYLVEFDFTGVTNFGSLVITIPPICIITETVVDVDLDWGDLPDSGAVESFGAAQLFVNYGTLEANNGPRHIVTEGVFLGASVDEDDDGQPDFQAQGDDFLDDDGDDEDGITFLTPLVPGQQATIEVTSTGGFLWGWLDIDGSGEFDHPTERIFDAAAVGASTQLAFDVDIDTQQTYFARFRFSTDDEADLTPLGGGANGVPDGEVEDYALMDYGDAPDQGVFGSYQTFDFPSNGPRHFVDPQVFLGANIDPDDDAHESADAKGDDTSDSTDDEDGVIFNGPLVAGIPTTATVTASVAGNLELWIDYNNDGDFATFDDTLKKLVSDPSDHVTAGAPFALNAGTNTITWTSPNNLISGISFARFRFTSNQGFGSSNEPFGLEFDGEVEDYRVQLFDLLPDMGDAPAPYPTLVIKDNGAVHLDFTGQDFTLGPTIDFESDGKPDDNALGDDNDNGIEFPEDNDPDDEDGVTFSGELIPSQAANVTVNVQLPDPPLPSDALLNAWIDWDGDGTWDDDEQIADDLVVEEGDTVLTPLVPADATAGTTFARFRLSQSGGNEPTGVAQGGEVEDYQVTITPLRVEQIVTIGDGAAKKVSFVDDDGTTVDFSVKGTDTTTDVTFTGVNLAQEVTGKGITVTGDDITVDQVDVIGSTNKAKLNIKGKGGDNMVDFTDVIINVDNAINSIMAKVVNFVDSVLNIGGLIAKFQANNLTDTELNIDHGDLKGNSFVVDAVAKPTKIQFKAAEDLTIDSNGPVDLKGNSFVNDDPTTDGVVAEYIKNANIKTDTAFAFTATGMDGKGLSIGSAKFGNFAGGMWTGPGAGKTFSALSIDGLELDFDGPFKTIRSKAGISNTTVSAHSTNKIDAKQDIVDSTFMFDNLLKNFKSKASIMRVDVEAGSGNKVYAKTGIEDSTFVFDELLKDFKSGASIMEVEVTAESGNKIDAKTGIEDSTFAFDSLIKNFKSGGSITDVDVTAGSASKIEAKVDIVNSTFTFTDLFDADNPKQRAFKSFKANQTVNNVDLVGNASFGKIAAGKVTDFNARTGIDDGEVALDALTAAAAAFAHEAKIDSVKIKGIKGDPVGIDNVFVLAHTIGKIDTAFAAGDEGDTFGFAAVNFAKGFRYKDADGRIKLKLADLSAGANPINDANTRLTLIRAV